jgi:glycosyltransferase 2 family protein
MKNSIIIKIFNLIIIFLSLWFIGQKLWVHHHWIISLTLSFKLISTVIILSVIYSLSEFLLSFSWRKLLILCGHKYISLNLSNEIYGKSQIAKYIPGNIFHVVSRHMLGSQVGIKHIVLAGATIYEILGLISTSALIGFSGMVIFGLGNIYFSFNQIIIILLTTIIISFSVVILAPYLMKIRGIILPNQKKWDYIYNIISIYIYYLLFFLIAGLILVFIVKIFFDLNLINSAKIIVIFSIAWVAGFIVPGAPGGIGVREAVIIFLISPIIGEAQGIAVAIVLRLVTSLGDMWFLFITNTKLNLKK